MATIAVVLPWPDPMLFPNKRRGSFRKFQPMIEEARLTGWALARKAIGADKPALGKRVPVRMMFGMPDGRNRDSDGLHGAVKHHMDGIASALGVNDKIFRPVLIDDCFDPEKKGYVRIEIGGEIPK